MATVHLLNTCPGDCTLIEHVSGHKTMIDICDGNIEMEVLESGSLEKEAVALAERVAGNFHMCEHPTNPIRYVKSLGIDSIFRFILTHPDMDHMDGLDALASEISIANFWDTGSRRDKPDFGTGPYLEEDWDRYEMLRDGRGGANSAIRQAGHRFAYANKLPDGQEGGDGLSILAPDSELIKDLDMDDDLNDGSYVILYRSAGGRILFPGDAHDVSWEYVLKHYPRAVKNCSFMLAPHHGRDSDRSYDFLDHIRPKLSLIGCAPSEYIDYAQWTRRNLDFITSNQAGNVVLEISDASIDVYIENEEFVKRRNGSIQYRNAKLNYPFLCSITKTEE